MLYHYRKNNQRIVKQEEAHLLLVICIVQYKQRRFSTYKCRQVYLTVNLIDIPNEQRRNTACFGTHFASVSANEETALSSAFLITVLCSACRKAIFLYHRHLYQLRRFLQQAPRQIHSHQHTSRTARKEYIIIWLAVISFHYEAIRHRKQRCTSETTIFNFK